MSRIKKLFTPRGLRICLIFLRMLHVQWLQTWPSMVYAPEASVKAGWVYLYLKNKIKNNDENTKILRNNTIGNKEKLLTSYFKLF